MKPMDMHESDQFSTNLGSEEDEGLIRRIRRVVVAGGGSMLETSYAVAGSQEIIEYSISVPGGNLTLVSETYIGLLLSGPEHLVQAIAQQTRDA
jgi:glycine cleavage system regulatory protein